MLSSTGLCDELITRPEESYRLWCVVVCDLENLRNEEAMTRVGSQRHKKKNPNRDNPTKFYTAKFVSSRSTPLGSHDDMVRATYSVIEICPAKINIPPPPNLTL